MIVIGLAGPAGAGKDSVADILVRTFGFVKFAFSDALYAEVRCAFNLPDESLLRDRATKEIPSDLLALKNCDDSAFYTLAADLLDPALNLTGEAVFHEPLSPRQILQWWGTEYRRADNPNYWLDRAEDFIFGLQKIYQYPEHAPQHFIECGTRFENEREWIKTGAFGDRFGGNIWHVHRGEGVIASAHASAVPLTILPGERQLWNNDSLERLERGVELLMTTPAEWVKVEPMEEHDKQA